MSSLKSTIVEIKTAYNIVDYIQTNGIRLKSSGRNKWKGLCPFHNEKSPSFTVDDHFQSYKCFGCGVSGDLLSYVQQHENLEFMDALRKLAEAKGITIEASSGTPGVDYSSLREAMREASNFFVGEYRKLPPDHPARKQVRDRKLSEKKMLYGYAPEGRQTLYKHLQSKGFSDETILQTGACLTFDSGPGIYDFWHGRLMFFITDITGKPIGWSGRKLYENDSRGKYVNSREGVLFDKSSSLYNIYSAKKAINDAEEVFICEGQFDVSTVVEVGLTQAVASSGTAFTEKQAATLRRLAGEKGRLVFCFDGDAAGVKATEKLFANLPSIHSQAYVVNFPEGQDPCDYRLAQGDDALIELLKHRQKPLVEFVIDNLTLQYNLEEELGSSQFLSQAARILKTVSHLPLREAYLRKVALSAFVGTDVVKEAVDKATALSEERPLEEKKLEVPVRPKLEDEEEQVSTEELVRSLAEDASYQLPAKLLAICFQEPALTPKLEECVPLFPLPLQSVAQEFIKFSPEGKIIPERFTHVSFIETLLGMNYFPFSHLMGEGMYDDHFAHLSSMLSTAYRQGQETAVRRKVFKVLENSSKSEAKPLISALAAEERGLKSKTLS